MAEILVAADDGSQARQSGNIGLVVRHDIHQREARIRAKAFGHQVLDVVAEGGLALRVGPGCQRPPAPIRPAMNMRRYPSPSAQWRSMNFL